ncbi:MAG: RAMP superfamily CRISPR-associated protein [Candidatus Heimdallarchaeaceae archaeon]
MNEEYFLVKQILPDEKSRKGLVSHNKYKGYSGILELIIETKSPIHIGTGNVEIDIKGIYWKFSKVKNIPIIPGSSLKGIVRSTLEALSPSCLGGRCKPEGKLCPACRIFGTTDYQSRVFFEDAFLQGDALYFREIFSIEDRWRPLLPHPGYRKFYSYSSSIKGGIERIESIKEGAKFISAIRFSNLEDWELGLLLLSIGISPNYGFRLKIGGGKGKGLGSIKIEIKGKYAEGSNFLSRNFRDINSDKEGFIEQYFNWAKDLNIKGKILKNINEFRKKW